LSTLRWVCSVLGAFDVVDLCDELHRALVRDAPLAAGWETGRRGNAAAKSPTTVVSEVRNAVAAHDERIAEMDFYDVSLLAAIEKKTFESLPTRSLSIKFVEMHTSLIAVLRDLLDSSDMEGLERRAHSFKTNARWIGALQCGINSAALEVAAHTARQSDVPLNAPIQSLLQRLEVDLQLTFEALKRMEPEG